MKKNNTLNVKLSNSKFNKLKSRIKNSTKVNWNLSSNLIGNSNDETNFPYKWTDTHVSRSCKAFSNGLPANIFFSKAQLSEMIQLGEFSPLNILSFAQNSGEAGTRKVTNLSDIAGY